MNLFIPPSIKKVCEVIVPIINSESKTGRMLFSVNSLQDVIKKYQNDIAPKFGQFTLSSLRPSMFTDFIPFKREGFEDVSGELLMQKEITPESFISIFFKTLANVIFIGAYIMFVLFIAMIVANDMIVLPPPLRVIGFIITASLGIFPPALFGFIGYYLLRAAYLASQNFILDPGNAASRPYFPRIFAILPVSTAEHESSFMRFITYPFTFPKSLRAEAKLVGITKDYIENMKRSFPGLEKYEGGFSQAGSIMNKALLAIINANRRIPVKSVGEFMAMPTDLPAPALPTQVPA